MTGIAVIFGVGAVIFTRWLRATAPQRNAVAPVLGAGCATLLALCGTLLFDPLGDVPANVSFAVSATVPLAVLFCFLQRRLARGMIAGLVVELDRTSPSLQLRQAAELRARLLELQASRARLVEATDAERRRIARDLHDGTQQRLVQIAMSLGLLESKLPADDASRGRSCARPERRWRSRPPSCGS